MAQSGKYGRITVELDSKSHPLNDPRSDEPVFLVRGRDAVAVLALVTYKQAALAHGAGPRVEIGMDKLIEEFRVWQRDHAHVVKTPD